MAYNKSLKVDAKQLACAHTSLILANNFAPVSEALVAQIINRSYVARNQSQYME